MLRICTFISSNFHLLADSQKKKQTIMTISLLLAKLSLLVHPYNVTIKYTFLAKVPKHSVHYIIRKVTLIEPACFISALELYTYPVFFLNM